MGNSTSRGLGVRPLRTTVPHVLCTTDTWRLMHYYNIPREQFIDVQDYVPHGARLPTGDQNIPVPSLFCHFVGAMMLYDPANRALFSGDLFGGVTDEDAEGLFGDESDWTGMRAFHQIYMPTNKVLQTAIDNIRRLDPPPMVIAPQHGRVIRGKWVEEFMGRLEELPVGLDIHEERFASDDDLQAWSTVLNRVVDTAEPILEKSIEEIVQESPQLRGIVDVGESRLEVTSLGKTSVERAVRRLSEYLPESMHESLKYEAVYLSGGVGAR